MDIDRLDFADSSFDLVTAGLVLQVLDDPAAAIAEIRRVLAPVGVLAPVTGRSVCRPFAVAG